MAVANKTYGILKSNETTVLKSSFFVCVVSDGGIEVSMVAFQAVDPGSIPGHRNHYFVRFYFVI